MSPLHACIITSRLRKVRARCTRCRVTSCRMQLPRPGCLFAFKTRIPSRADLQISISRSNLSSSESSRHCYVIHDNIGPIMNGLTWVQNQCENDGQFSWKTLVNSRLCLSGLMSVTNFLFSLKSNHRCFSLSVTFNENWRQVLSVEASVLPCFLCLTKHSIDIFLSTATTVQ